MASGQETSEGLRDYSMAKLIKPLKPPLTPQEQKQKEDAFSKDIMDTMTTSMMMVIGMIVFLPMILKSFGSRLGIAQAQTQTLQGHIDSRVLQATPALQWMNLISDPPYTAWVTASFFNDGLLVGGIVVANSVFIGINNPDELHELMYGEQYNVNMTGSRGIELIYYRSNNGATVRVVGKY